MAEKSDFTEQEWETMQKGVAGAGLLVSVSEKGFMDTFKEAGALSKQLGEARERSVSPFIREVAEVKGRGGFGLTDSPEEIEKATLDALSAATATLQAKAPDESVAYAQFVVDIAESVANAAKGVAAGETGAIDKIRSAVGAS